MLLNILTPKAFQFQKDYVDYKRQNMLQHEQARLQTQAINLSLIHI